MICCHGEGHRSNWQQKKEKGHRLGKGCSERWLPRGLQKNKEPQTKREVEKRGRALCDEKKRAHSSIRGMRSSGGEGPGDRMLQKIGGFVPKDCGIIAPIKTVSFQERRKAEIQQDATGRERGKGKKSANIDCEEGGKQGCTRPRRKPALTCAKKSLCTSRIRLKERLLES